MDEFRLLHLLRLKGLVAAPAAATLLVRPETELLTDLRRLGTEGLVTERTGRLQGWSLTADGRARHADLLAAERRQGGGHPDLRVLYGRFEPINHDLKSTVSAWQLASLTPSGEPGDRAELRQGFERLHAAATPVINQMGAALPRMSAYAGRLQRAKDRFDDGDDNAMTKPLSESYHDVWMELHQDLLLTLDLQRGEGDA